MMDLQRLDIGNALYYVELKSNGHRPLFAERSGFSAFIDLLAELDSHTHAKIIAYCLLQDTVYLIVQNGQSPLIQTTRHITDQYTLFAQKQWNHHGSLFNKYHHSLLLEPSRFLLPCVQYVHQRPVAMGLVAEASIYPWSSLQSYIGESSNAWLDTSALQQFTGLATLRRSTHLECLNQAPTETLNLQQGNHSEVWALASDGFIQNLLHRQSKSATPPTLDWLTQEICDRHHISLSDLNLRHGHRRYLEVRAEIAALMLEFHIETDTQDTEIQNTDTTTEPIQIDCDEDITAPTQELIRALEDKLGTSMDLLQPLVLTLRETRTHYLHGLYLDLRKQWRLSMSDENHERNTNEEAPADLGTTQADDDNASAKTSTETDDSAIEESPSLSN